MDECLDLPPGFRFHPTDEEIITHYLTMKVLQPTFTARAIGEVDLNKSEPWDLPSKAKMGEKEWYFFCQRDRKYPTGMRTNRATESGYWKATGKDKEIFRGRGGGGTSSSSSHAHARHHQHQHHHVLVGMKKTLVFYTGRAPKGEKTNWVMHEYRLDGKSPFPPNHLPPRPSNSKDEWVVCRVFHKGNGPKKSPTATTTLMPPAAAAAGAGLARMNSFADILDSPNLPPLLDSTSTPSSSYFNSNNNNNNSESSFDFKGMPSSYYYSMMGLDDLNPNSSSVNAQMGVQIAPPMSSTFNNYNAANFMGYFQQQQQQQQQQDESVNQMRQCKVEQLPNHSMLSDDTGLSTDRNTEISSVVSRHDIGSCTSYDATAEASLDLDNMWN